MAKVMAGACMSLDGYISGPGETGFEHLFRWLDEGDVEVPTAQPERTLRMSAASAGHMREQIADTAALVVGRRLFDLTRGWGGTHPFGIPVFVVTHRAPEGWGGTPFTFVTDGLESAVEQAKAAAGDRWVGVNGGSMAQQCLRAGLLDELRIDLIPVLLGGGVPFFGELPEAIGLSGPRTVTGEGVTHLYYEVTR